MQQHDHAAAATVAGEPAAEPVAGDGQTAGIALVAAVVVIAALARPVLARLLDDDAIAHWATIFVAITVQAMPFLVLGVTVSAALATFVAPRAMARLIPDRPVLAVPVATLAGAALPGCECGSVPIAGRLVSRGVPDAAALTFLLAAPAINPVVLVATAVAFPGQPSVVIARLVASAAAAMVVGFLWTRFGRAEWLDRTRLWHSDPQGSRLATFVGTALHDLLHAGGFLIIGAATAATLQTVIPRSVLDSVAGAGLMSVLALALLAVVMAICSEADAFVAASLTQFSPTARLTFMVVGPMVDVKLIALQAGTFGSRFAARFAPLTFAVAIACSVVVGWWLL